MNEYKCEVCGGNIVLQENENCGVCDSCGRRQRIQKYSRPISFKENSSIQDSDNIENYITRIEIFLSDKDWINADRYCEKVLDLDPKNGWAYAYKLMIDFKCSDFSELSNINKNPSDMTNFKLAIENADDELSDELNKVCGKLANKFEKEANEKKYKYAKQTMNFAKTKEDIYEAKKLFAELNNYKDSAELVARCDKLADDFGNEKYLGELNKAKELMNKTIDFVYAGKIANAIKKKYKISDSNLETDIVNYFKFNNYKEARNILANISHSYSDVQNYDDNCIEFISEFNVSKEKINMIEDCLSQKVENPEKFKKDSKTKTPFVYKIIPIVLALLLVFVGFFYLNYSKGNVKVSINSLYTNGSEKPDLIILYNIKNSSFTGKIDSIDFVVYVSDLNNNYLGYITTSLNSMNLNHGDSNTYTTTINYQYNNSFYNTLINSSYKNLKFEFKIENLKYSK